MSSVRVKSSLPARRALPTADEQLILVDEANRAIGTAGKDAIHRTGLLHRAFSIFIVDDRGRILLQQRNPRKYHSGGLWANSCCGHPRPGERTVSGARRRLNEELGVTGDLSFGFFARYEAARQAMHENELVCYFGGCGLAETRSGRGRDGRVCERRRHPPSHRAQPGAFAYWLRHYFRHHPPTSRLAGKTARRER